MIKIALEVDGVRSTVKHKDGCTIHDVLLAFDGVLKGCGFCYKGILTIEDVDNG